jgi:hypothetical protein
MLPSGPVKPNLLIRAWGRGPNDVYAAGFDGVLLHCDGRAWSPVPLGTTEGPGVFGVGPSDVFVVGGGGMILHQGGGSSGHDGTRVGRHQGGKA